MSRIEFNVPIHIFSSDSDTIITENEITGILPSFSILLNLNEI